MSVIARRRWWVIGILLVTTVLVIADRSGWLLIRRPDDLSTYHGVRAKVTRIIDGDTIEVDIRDHLHDRHVTQIRLWGIVCPEPAGPGRPGEPLAAEATALARTLAGGRRVTLTLEPRRPRGTDGRVLAHVQLPDSSSLNEALLAAGLARTDPRWTHSQLKQYAEIERAARRGHLGIWHE